MMWNGDAVRKELYENTIDGAVSKESYEHTMTARCYKKWMKWKYEILSNFMNIKQIWAKVLKYLLIH